jgi:hypothetical protein
VEAFYHFSPLLAASQGYAGLSGCRFRRDSFRDLDDEEPEEEPSASECLLAKRCAAPAVRSFTERLRAREPALLEEAERAYRIVMAESVRNAMVACFRQLDLWPPSPCPPGVGADDCAYEDLSASVPVIAQRAWNDQVRRQREADSLPGCGVGSSLRCAMTASYLVDFVHEVGVELPPEPEQQLALLSDFNAKAERWLQEQEVGARETTTTCRTSEATSTATADIPASLEEPDLSGDDAGGNTARPLVAAPSAGGAVVDGSYVLCGNLGNAPEKACQSLTKAVEGACSDGKGQDVLWQFGRNVAKYTFYVSLVGAPKQIQVCVVAGQAGWRFIRWVLERHNDTESPPPKRADLEACEEATSLP